MIAPRHMTASAPSVRSVLRAAVPKPLRRGAYRADERLHELQQWVFQ